MVLIESSLSSRSSPALVLAETRWAGLGVCTGVMSRDRSGSVSPALLSGCSLHKTSSGGSTTDEHTYRNQFWKWRIWWCTIMYRRVSFYNGSYYDDVLLQPLSGRTEHTRLLVHHNHNSSILSLLSALLGLFQCACVSYFSILLQFF
jgi:hypothetical protein